MRISVLQRVMSIIKQTGMHTSVLQRVMSIIKQTGMHTYVVMQPDPNVACAIRHGYLHGMVMSSI